MQIPSVNLAASLAGITGKPTSDSKPAAEANSITSQPHVEQSGESNPDRDAQGQGDGMGSRRSNNPSTPEGGSETNSQDQRNSDASAPLLPDDPPSQLDLLG